MGEIVFMTVGAEGAKTEAKVEVGEGKSSHPCEKCGVEMGSGFILGPICGKCCRKNHREVIGK